LRCGYPVEDILNPDADKCRACLRWEGDLMVRKPSVPSAISEGIYRYPRSQDTVRFDFWYPRTDDEPHLLQVGLYDVRAADDIRISYDFDRDGWKIEQAWIEVVVVPPSPEHGGGYDDHVDRWEEVAFIRAWDMNRQKGMAGPGTEENE
jgi:hypothetical protein